MSKHPEILPELVTQRILILRGVKVMLDADLADLYAVQTKALNQACVEMRKDFQKISCSA